MKFLKDLKDLEGKKVLIRVGMDVPLENGRILDDTRIKTGINSIKHCIDMGAKVLLLNHIGRPADIKNKLSLSNKILAEKLSGMLEKEISFTEQITGDDVHEKISLMDNGDVLLLENVRFDPREMEDDEEFAKEIASLGDVYVNDAFSVSHRKQTSVNTIMRHLPAYAGLLLDLEIKNLNKVLKAKDKPFVVVLGGKKIKDKIPVIENMIGVADAILIGGAMAYTFLKVMGKDVKNSIVDTESLGLVEDILNKIGASRTELILPIDTVWNNNDQGSDIGPKTLELFKEKLKTASLIFWNGTLGINEDSNYVKGTNEIAKMISDSTATTVIGGGDTIGAVSKLNLLDAYTHASTGGGASMEFISGKTLPGIAALDGVFEVHDAPTKRRIMIAGNWKMNKTIDEALIFADKFNSNFKKMKTDKVDILVCAPYTCLHTLIEMFADTKVMVGAENMHWENSGAFTGEISGEMLKNIGCTHVIIGHSERRQYFGELNKTVNKKIIAALKNELTPVVCLGETLSQREDDKTKEVIQNQFERCFADITGEEMKKLIIAYEPIWAIGTGKTATPEQAQSVHAFIRSLIKDHYSSEVAASVRILYGGSMKPENASELASQIDVDGGLIGGASLDADSFAKIVEVV